MCPLQCMSRGWQRWAKGQGVSTAQWNLQCQCLVIRACLHQSKSPRHTHNPLSGEWMKTLSICHHARSLHFIVCFHHHSKWLPRQALVRTYMYFVVWGLAYRGRWYTSCWLLFMKCMVDLLNTWILLYSQHFIVTRHTHIQQCTKTVVHSIW